MPKKGINYSNVYFYKIVCRDLSITDCYIGSTTDFTKRKYSHKTRCNNENDSHYNIPLYQFIRQNQGWNNFDMVLIETGSFENSLEVHKHERALIEALGASINARVPSRSKKEQYINNKEETNAYRNTKCTCICNGRYTLRNVAQHCKSKKHQDYISKQEQNEEPLDQ